MVMGIQGRQRAPLPLQLSQDQGQGLGVGVELHVCGSGFHAPPLTPRPALALAQALAQAHPTALGD